MGLARRLLCRPFLLLLLAALSPMYVASRCSAAISKAGLPPSPTIVDIDLTKGTTTVSGPDRNVAAAPGSTLKPFVLLTALRLGAITSHSRIACTGVLRVGDRNLACVHPASLGALDAEEALAYSCNSYVAAVSRHLSTPVLQAGLRRYRIEALQPIPTPEARVLFALGLEKVKVTPLQLAQAYAALARDPSVTTSAGEPIRQGLRDSVEYGMAHAAQTPGLVVGGKTGTAHDDGPLLQHGWFAGIVFAANASARPLHVVVTYAPGGNGNDAALAAHAYLQQRSW